MLQFILDYGFNGCMFSLTDWVALPLFQVCNNPALMHLWAHLLFLLFSLNL